LPTEPATTGTPNGTGFLECGMATAFLHPGAMGASIAALCPPPRLWCGVGRSSATRHRAEAAGMDEVDSVDELARRADVVVSVCPPAATFEVADRVAATGFDGVYVDVNAVSPATARTIGARFTRFVDGGIIGPPVHAPDTTRVYLSGPDAAHVADLWRDTALETRVIDGDPGAASAVKTCFAAWTKGTAALLLAIRALAAAEGVEDDLLGEWATSIPGLAEQCELTALGNAPKGWRFAGELEESAAAFAARGLPDGFGEAAAEIYRRLAPFKDTSGADLEAVIDALNRPSEDEPSEDPA
jgi:3-hydroxyisobutyrate dehydrogenase-like beta-hydroxyacid dehydrogenase